MDVLKYAEQTKSSPDETGGRNCQRFQRSHEQDGNTITDDHTFTYDAWNRLVGTSALTRTYSYDALGRRIGYSFDHVEARDDYFYSSDGHDIEDHFCGGITDQYVWSLGGPNEMVLRDSSDGSNTGGENLGKADSELGERLYVEQDANENVTALAGPHGTVVQHFVYDPYGAVIVVNAAYTATTSDGYNWSYMFQGGRMDGATGLYLFGARNYSPTLGRWTTQDPAGYIDGLNDYQFVESDPVDLVDPSGLKYEVIAKASYVQYEMTPGPGSFDKNRKLGNVTVELLADTTGPKVKLKYRFTWQALTTFRDQALAQKLNARISIPNPNGAANRVGTPLVWTPNKGADGNDLPLDGGGDNSSVDAAHSPGSTIGSIDLGEIDCPGDRKGDVHITVQGSLQWISEWSAKATCDKVVTGTVNFLTTKNNVSDPAMGGRGAVPTTQPTTNPSN